jgi:tellurite resistance protein
MKGRAMPDGTFFANQLGQPPRRSFDFKSFFTNIAMRQEESWTPAEAFLFIAVSAASSDGNISPEESEQILITMHRSRLFREASADELRRIHSVVGDRLAKRGERALVDACAALPPHLALPAFAVAVDIVLADGVFVRAEAEFLDQLMELLAISHDDAGKIAEVMNIKNGC